MRFHRISITTLVVIFSRALNAQAPLDTVRIAAAVAREVVRVGERNGNNIWPSFRPDTIPLSFVIPSRGDALIGWRGALPTGYTAIAEIPGAAWREQRALGAASTATSLEGRSVAQVVINTLSPSMLAATAVHEAFHVFEGASRRPNRKFGQGENAMLVSTYPVFDERNEIAFALEGKLLASALTAPRNSEKRSLVRQFVAVRRERHRTLPSQFAEFDEMSELNEGLAEYALVRALQIVAADGPAAWRAGAIREMNSRLPLLEEVTRSENLSLRFRFYQTGPAQGLLLDELAGPNWKSDMLARDATLEDMLAVASGIDDAAIAARDIAEKRASALHEQIVAQINHLKSARQANADSLLSLPGLKLILSADSLPGKDFNSCGYDPQNLLQVSETTQIQMRWWRPCAGGPTYAEFNVPSVHDEAHGTVSAVIGDEASVKLTSNGQPLIIRDGETRRDLTTFKLVAPRATVEAVRADVSRAGNVLEIHPKRP